MMDVTLSTSVKIRFWQRASRSIYQRRAEPGGERHRSNISWGITRSSTGTEPTNLLTSVRCAKSICRVFEAAVKEANVGAIMDSYISSTAHTSAERLLTRTSSKMSGALSRDHNVDWTSTYDGIAAATAGSISNCRAGAFMKPEKKRSWPRH